MNTVILIGRLTRDPDIRYTADNQLCIASFPIACDRGRDREGNDRGADYPWIKVFGKQAENCGKWLYKGRQVAIRGRINTGNYTDKNGNKVYTTDVVAEEVKFLGGKKDNNNEIPPERPVGEQMSYDDIPDGFQQVEDDVPF